jgi:hypothetical protein
MFGQDERDGETCAQLSTSALPWEDGDSFSATKGTVAAPSYGRVMCKGNGGVRSSHVHAAAACGGSDVCDK